MSRPGPIQRGPTLPGQRVAPPPELSPDERAAWIAITSSMPADFFSAANQDLLVLYVRHTGYAASLADDIAEARLMVARLQVELREVVPGARADTLNALTLAQKRLAPLLQAHTQQSRQIAHLASKLRLANSSRYENNNAITKDRAPKVGPSPWSDWGADALPADLDASADGSTKRN